MKLMEILLRQVSRLIIICTLFMGVQLYAQSLVKTYSMSQLPFGINVLSEKKLKNNKVFLYLDVTQDFSLEDITIYGIFDRESKRYQLLFVPDHSTLSPFRKKGAEQFFKLTIEGNFTGKSEIILNSEFRIQRAPHPFSCNDLY